MPTSCKAARVAAPCGISWCSCGGKRATRAWATQPTFRQWSRTLMPGLPSSFVFAQQCSCRTMSPILDNVGSLFLEPASTPTTLPERQSEAKAEVPTCDLCIGRWYGWLGVGFRSLPGRANPSRTFTRRTAETLTRQRWPAAVKSGPCCAPCPMIGHPPCSTAPTYDRSRHRSQASGHSWKQRTI